MGLVGRLGFGGQNSEREEAQWQNLGLLSNKKVAQSRAESSWVPRYAGVHGRGWAGGPSPTTQPAQSVQTSWGG